MSRSVVYKPSLTYLRRSHIPLVALLFLAGIMAAVASAETEASSQKGDLILPPLSQSLAISKESLSLAMNLAGTEGLRTLQRFVKENELYAKRLGYESLSQIADEKQLMPQLPFLVFRLGLTQLRNYDGNIAMLFARRETIRLVVPIAVAGQGEGKQKPPLSAITVRLGGDKNTGKIIEWGSKNLIKHLSKRRDDLAQDKEISGPKSRDELVMDKEMSGLPVFIMEIPALNRLYLGYKKLEKIMLVPISGVKPTERTERIEQPMEEVLKTLSKEAQTIDNKPR